MMRRFAFALLLALPVPACAATPLFDDFKTLCVDTHAGIDPARRAVRAAGGTVTSDSVLNKPLPTTEIRWDHRLGNVTLNGQVLWIEDRNKSAIASCTVETPTIDDASIARLRDWAGIPPATVLKKGRAESIIFHWQELDGRHVPVPEGVDRRKVHQEGHDCIFVIHRFEQLGTTSVTLTNVLPAPQ